MYLSKSSNIFVLIAPKLSMQRFMWIYAGRRGWQEKKTAFVQIKKCICQNQKNVFVQIITFICFNCKLYVSLGRQRGKARKLAKRNLYLSTSCNVFVQIKECVCPNYYTYICLNCKWYVYVGRLRGIERKLTKRKLDKTLLE